MMVRRRPALSAWNCSRVAGTSGNKNAFRWGYGHVVVFASLAALGAGIEVAIDAVTDQASERIGALAVAIPMACYPLGLALIMTLNGMPVRDPRVAPKILGAAAMVAIGLLAPVAAAVAGCAVVMTVLAGTMALSDPPAPVV